MSYIPLVETPLMVVVHDSVTGVSDITAEQIKAVYSGEITNWQELGGPDEQIILFDLSEDENEKVVLREAYLGPDLEISPDAVVFTEDDELVETTVGPVELPFRKRDTNSSTCSSCSCDSKVSIFWTFSSSGLVLVPSIMGERCPSSVCFSLPSTLMV